MRELSARGCINPADWDRCPMGSSGFPFKSLAGGAGRLTQARLLDSSVGLGASDTENPLAKSDSCTRREISGSTFSLSMFSQKLTNMDGPTRRSYFIFSRK